MRRLDREVKNIIIDYDRADSSVSHFLSFSPSLFDASILPH